MNYLLFIIIFWMLYTLYFFYKYDKAQFIVENWKIIKDMAMRSNSELFHQMNLLEGRDYN